VIRAYNIVSADCFRDFSDRMTPAAIIPMHAPEEAIEELGGQEPLWRDLDRAVVYG
jgi:hypothetical protein